MKIDIDRLRFIFNCAFMIGTVVVIVLYFTMPADRPMPLFIVGTIAVVIKFAEYALRIQQNMKKRNEQRRNIK